MCFTQRLIVWEDLKSCSSLHVEKAERKYKEKFCARLLHEKTESRDRKLIITTQRSHALKRFIRMCSNDRFAFPRKKSSNLMKQHWRYFLLPRSALFPFSSTREDIFPLTLFGMWLSHGNATLWREKRESLVCVCCSQSGPYVCMYAYSTLSDSCILGVTENNVVVCLSLSHASTPS